MTASNINLGRWGEDHAVEFLIVKGYRIIKRNFRNKLGEIDIIAQDLNGVICFIEVKTRLSLDKGFPFESVDSRKQEKLRKLALSFLKFWYQTCEIKSRFEVMSIIRLPNGQADIKHIVNAF